MYALYTPWIRHWFDLVILNRHLTIVVPHVNLYMSFVFCFFFCIGELLYNVDVYELSPIFSLMHMLNSRSDIFFQWKSCLSVPCSRLTTTSTVTNLVHAIFKSRTWKDPKLWTTYLCKSINTTKNPYSRVNKWRPKSGTVSLINRQQIPKVNIYLEITNG